MQLPFSHDVFLDVFAMYNAELWPASLFLWVATAAMAFRWLAGSRVNGPVLFGLLSVHWMWSGIAYHWLYFREINRAATLFAAAFVFQGVLFLWMAVKSRAHTDAPSGLRGAVAGGLVLYGLAYPAIGLAMGLEYPRLPLFAVPCPATLVTAGFLLGTVGAPRFASVVPILWAVIGGSAAFALGITADLVLIVAAAVLALDLFAPMLFRRRIAV